MFMCMNNKQLEDSMEEKTPFMIEIKKIKLLEINF